MVVDSDPIQGTQFSLLIEHLVDTVCHNILRHTFCSIFFGAE